VGLNRFWDNPDLSQTGASMREEWRAEQEDAARDAGEVWQHDRSLVDALVELMHRGDRVAVNIAGRRIAGEVVDVGDDVLSVLQPAGRVDIHVRASIPLHVQIDERARSGGRRSDGAAPSFRARLLEWESAGEELSLAALGSSEPVDGALAVGADFVMIHTRLGADHYFPIDTVAYVMPRLI
jgi:hypothetical protein